MVINSDSGNYRCADTSANRCQRRAAVKADRVDEGVPDAVRVYSATADAPRRASHKQQIREADEAIERANAHLDDTIRQLAELGLMGRPATRETLEKLATTLDDAHTARARLGDRGESNPDRHQVPGPASIRKPPAATSRASVATLGSYDLHNSLDPPRRTSSWARLPQPREAAARDRRHRRCGIRPSGRRDAAGPRSSVSAVGCTEPTIRGSPAVTATRSARLSQPWQRNSEASAAGVLETSPRRSPAASLPQRRERWPTRRPVPCDADGPLESTRPAGDQPPP